MAHDIADTTLVAQRPGEAAFDLRIRVGAPREVAPDEWACAVDIAPWPEPITDIHGIDALQSLCLATSLVLRLLREFQARGGTLRTVQGFEFPLEAYCVEATIARWKDV